MRLGGIGALTTFGATIGLTTIVVGLVTPQPPTGAAPQPDGPGDFVNWENHPIHSLEITPGGDRLLLTNTPDGRLEVFDITGAEPFHLGSIPVGLDPVSVRAASDQFAWVVNHISDSVSMVDLTTMNVVRTLQTADEPFDCIIAGDPARLFVACSQANLVQVFDLGDLSAPPLEIPIDAEDPRAMAVSPDGSQVYLAIWESGNGSTILGGGIDPAVAGVLAFPPNVVSDPAGPYAGLNPPPNDGAGFSPPLGAGAANPPAVGLIVRKDDAGRWM
ncbi:MAG: YncE family protein, partial [Phycisphaerales bacterium JB039]